MAHCTIPSLGPLSIASVHARVIDRRVIPPLYETFEELRPRLGHRFIVGGDLNTAREAARRWPRNRHAEFWNDLEEWGFKDCLLLASQGRASVIPARSPPEQAGDDRWSSG